MTRTIVNKLQSVALILAFSIILFGCKKNDDGDGGSTNNDIGTQINALPKETLSADEVSSLEWMREEEKLAHDVYLTLYTKWNIPVFKNIASSEQTHADAVLSLLQKYNLADPAAAKAQGVFSDTTLQNLYNQLVFQGSKSALDGYIVGATIEDLDIYDLNNWNAKVDNEDIKFVFQNLTKGSRNHMRSFYNQITANGGTYTAQYISQSDLNAIINSPKETGSW